MVHRSKRVVQWHLRLQYVFGTTFPIPVPIHDIAVHVVYRAIFLSYRFCNGSGTERNRRIHNHQHYWSYEHCRNGTYNYINQYIIINNYKKCNINILVLLRIQCNIENNELSWAGGGIVLSFDTHLRGLQIF